MPRAPLLAVATGGLSALLAAQGPPPGFTWQPLTTALDDAVAMAFAPDGRLFLAERRSGDIHVLAHGTLQPTPWATIPVHSANGWNEQGLLGIAVDPAFATNGHVYVFYTAPGGGQNHIARLTDVNGNGSALTVLSPAGALPGSFAHNGGALTIGHDGMLYVATGELTLANLAQDPASWCGKVLRLSLPGLGIPADNPFANSPVFSLGHRNHFGLAVHPESGTLFQTENGEQTWDEINRIVRGGNHGWPMVEGPEPTPNAAWVDPLRTYAPTAPTGCAFWHGEHYPASWQDTLFVGEWNTGDVRALTLDAQGTSVVADRIFHDRSGSAYALANGPDGNLWLLADDQGGFGGNMVGRYVHQAEATPSTNLSVVANRALGGAVTLCVHGHDGELAVGWLSTRVLPTPVTTPFGRQFVPIDAVMPLLLIVADDRAYQAIAVPNLPTLIGTTVHGQALTLAPATGVLTASGASRVTLRG